MLQENSNREIRIIIADDHQLFRNGLRLLLGAFPGFNIVGEASDGAEQIGRASCRERV